MLNELPNIRISLQNIEAFQLYKILKYKMLRLKGLSENPSKTQKIFITLYITLQKRFQKIMEKFFQYFFMKALFTLPVDAGLGGGRVSYQSPA